MRNRELPKHALVDYLKERCDCVTDYELARELNVAASMISKYRWRTCAVSPALILDIHEKFDMPVAAIKLLIEEANDQFAHR